MSRNSSRALNTLHPDRRKRARIRSSEATRRIKFGIVQRSNEINQWLHHVLDLPCWSNWWPPSSIIRINSPLTITNVILRVHNYLEHCFHEDRSPSLYELISSVNLSLFQLVLISTKIHKISSRSCFDRIFAYRVAKFRCTWSIFHFIFLFCFPFSKLTWKLKRSRVSSRREHTSRSWIALFRVNHTHLPPA